MDYTGLGYVLTDAIKLVANEVRGIIRDTTPRHARVLPVQAEDEAADAEELSTEPTAEPAGERSLQVFVNYESTSPRLFIGDEKDDERFCLAASAQGRDGSVLHRLADCIYECRDNPASKAWPLVEELLR